MMSIVCPGCSKAGKVPAAFAGKRVRCRRCDYQFAVVAEEGPPKIPLVGRVDFENFTHGDEKEKSLVQRATEAGYFTGFRQLRAKKDE